MAETNPYLALLQERPRGNPWDLLSNALLGLGSGISQAGASGQGWGAGIAPGLMQGMQMTAQAEHAAEQERLRRAQFGLQAQEWDEKRKVREQQQAAMDRWQKLMTGGGAPDQGTTTPGITAPQPSPVQMGPGTPDQNAIGGIESGGRYDAVGPVANKAGNRAYGKYQIMDFNVGPWTQEVFGKAMTPQEFLANPQAQDAVFNAKFGQYSQKYGPVGASRAWFAGEGGMNNPNASDVNGMTVQRYGDRFAQSRGVASPPPPPPPQVAQGDAGTPRAGAPSPAGPPPMPQFASLPPFEGPGMGGFQPGATDRPTLMPPPQVAQGDNVPASGASVDPNAPMPAAVGGPLPPPGGPNAVPVQYNPTPATPGMPTAPPQAPAGAPPLQPPTVPMPRPQDLPASYRQYLASLPVTTPHEAMTATTQAMTQYRQQLQEQANKQWERQWSEYAHSRGLTEEQAKELRDQQAAAAVRQEERQFEQKPMLDSQTNQIVNVPKSQWGDKRFVPLDAQKEAREAERLALEKQKAEQDAAQVAVDPKTMRPNQPAIDAAAAKAAAEAKARADVEMQNKPALQFAEKEVARFSETVQPGAEAAANGLTNLYEMKRLTEGNMATGPGIEGRMFTARLLDTLGIKDMPQGMVNTTEYLNRASKGVISVLQTGALGKTQISEGDRKFVEDMAAKNVGYTKQELDKLVDVAIKASHKVLDDHGKSVDRIGRLIGDKVAKDYFKVDRQTFEEWKKDNPAPGNTGAPGATTQGGTFPAPTPAAIKALQMSPTKRDEFDALFGPGAAAKALGR